MRLSTRRLVLRPVQPGDEDALLALYGDPVFMRFSGSETWHSRSQAADFIARAAVGLAHMDSVRLAILEEDGLVGTCGLLSVDAANRRAELGYGVRVDRWGRGIAGEAVRALLGWSFDELQLNRVSASVDPANTTSIRVLSALGFQREGLMREHLCCGKQAMDTAVYGLLAREWREAAAPADAESGGA